MKTRIAFMVALLMGGALAWDWWQQGGSMQPAAAVAPALPADVMGLIDQDKPYTVVHAWATWCPPCMAEMPSLLQEAKRGRKDVKLVMISADAEIGALERFYEVNGVDVADTRTSLWLHDPSQTLIAKMEDQRVVLPLTIAYARDGRVVQVIRDRVVWPSFLDALEKARYGDWVTPPPAPNGLPGGHSLMKIKNRRVMLA